MGEPGTPVDQPPTGKVKPLETSPGYAAETDSSYRKVVAGPRLQSPPPTPRHVGRSPRASDATPVQSNRRISAISPDATPKARPLGSPKTRVEPFRFATQEHASPASPSATPKAVQAGSPPSQGQRFVSWRYPKPTAKPHPLSTPLAQVPSHSHRQSAAVSPASPTATPKPASTRTSSLQQNRPASRAIARRSSPPSQPAPATSVEQLHPSPAASSSSTAQAKSAASRDNAVPCTAPVQKVQSPPTQSSTKFRSTQAEHTLTAQPDVTRPDRPVVSQPTMHATASQPSVPGRVYAVRTTRVHSKTATQEPATPRTISVGSSVAPATVAGQPTDDRPSQLPTKVQRGPRVKKDAQPSTNASSAAHKATPSVPMISVTLPTPVAAPRRPRDSVSAAQSPSPPLPAKTASTGVKTNPRPPMLTITAPTPTAAPRRPTEGLTHIPIPVARDPAGRTQSSRDRSQARERQPLSGPRATGVLRDHNVPRDPNRRTTEGSIAGKVSDMRQKFDPAIGGTQQSKPQSGITRVSAAPRRSPAPQASNPWRGERIPVSGSIPLTTSYRNLTQVVAQAMAEPAQEQPAKPVSAEGTKCLPTQTGDSHQLQPKMLAHEHALNAARLEALARASKASIASIDFTRVDDKVPKSQVSKKNAEDSKRRCAKAARWVEDITRFGNRKRKGKGKQGAIEPESEDEEVPDETADEYDELDANGDWRPPSPGARNVDIIYRPMPIFEYPWFEGRSKNSDDYLIDLKGNSMDHAIDVRPYLIHIGQYARRKGFHGRDNDYKWVPFRDGKSKEEDDDICVQAGKKYLLYRWKERGGYFMTPSDKFAKLNQIWEVATIPWAVYAITREIAEKPPGEENDTGFSLDPDWTKINRYTRDDGTIFTNIRLPLVQRRFCVVDPVYHPIQWKTMVLKQYHKDICPIPMFHLDKCDNSLKYAQIRFEEYLAPFVIPQYKMWLDKVTETYNELVKHDQRYEAWNRYWDGANREFHDGQGNYFLPKGQKEEIEYWDDPPGALQLKAEPGHDLKTEDSLVSSYLIDSS